MALRISFRVKLMAVVAVAAFSLIALVITSMLLTQQVDDRMQTIQRSYMPKVALRPVLEAAFERIKRGLQDAVAASDADVLAATRAHKTAFVTDLSAAREAVDAAQAGALERAIDDYFTTAYDVSRRLIAGETGESIVN